MLARIAEHAVWLNRDVLCSKCCEKLTVTCLVCNIRRIMLSGKLLGQDKEVVPKDHMGLTSSEKVKQYIMVNASFNYNLPVSLGANI